MPKGRRSKRLCALLAACGVLLCLDAAAQGDSSHPLSTPPAPLQAAASIGTGIYAASGNGFAALLRGGIEVDVPPNLARPVTSLCPQTRRGLGVDCGTDQYLYRRLDVVGAFSKAPQGPAVPYLEVHFYPKENQVYAPVPSETENVLVADMQFLPVQIGRDIAIDESLRLVISSVAAAAKYWIPLGANLAIFLQYTLDVLGYKAVRYVSDVGPFDGVHVAGGHAQLGIGWTGTPDLTIYVSIGNRIDYNRWTRSQLDLAFAATARADVASCLGFFVQPQFVRQWDSSHGWVENGELIGGFDLVF
jgi:hypothetical protein